MWRNAMGMRAVGSLIRGIAMALCHDSKVQVLSDRVEYHISPLRLRGYGKLCYHTDRLLGS